MNDDDAQLDESPTDELPVLTEHDVVDIDGNSILVLADDARVSAPTDPTAAEPGLSTGRFPRPDELPDVEPFEEPDEERAFLKRQIVLLEATLDDKEAEIASLAERLRATRDAVARRDETEARLRAQLADLESERERRDARLAEAEALAAEYAERVAELTSRLRTLEQTASKRDAAIAELEAELIAREARIVERERALHLNGAGDDDGAPTSVQAELVSAESPAAGAESASPPRSDTETALARSREEAAALAAYIDCRRAHWLALEAQLEEHRERLRELEQEVEQRAERERREAERADDEARRADALKAELARLRTLPSAADAAPATSPAAAPEPSTADGEAAPAEKPRRSLEETPTATLRVARPDIARPPEAALVCLTSDPPRTYRLSESATVIGRAAHCGIRIATHFVSREHARIVRERDELLIEDLGSKNGVFVNAVRVERGPLRHGDLVTIGETQFRFERAPDSNEAA